MLKHIKKIEDCKILLIKDEKAYYCSKNILGIQGIGSEAYSWRSGEAQIDLIIDRKDNVVNLCEIKFSLGKYKLTKRYA